VGKVINPEYLIASEKHNYGDSHWYNHLVLLNLLKTNKLWLT
jgi:hypothetical protein